MTVRLNISLRSFTLIVVIIPSSLYDRERSVSNPFVQARENINVRKKTGQPIGDYLDRRALKVGIEAFVERTRTCYNPSRKEKVGIGRVNFSSTTRAHCNDS